MPASASGPELRQQLAGWTAQGLIDAGQAARIGAAEAARAEVPAVMPSAAKAGPVPGTVPRRLPLVAEALGYLGGVLAVMAGLISARSLWPTIPPGTQLAFGGIAAAALLAVGILLPTRRQPALGRLRSVLWLTSAAALAATGILLTGPRFGNMGPAAGPLVTEAVVTAYAVILWWRTRAALQHLAAFAGMAALAGTAIAQTGEFYENWRIGAGVWVLSLVWGVAVHHGYLVPRTAGYIAAGVGMLVGAQLILLTTDLPGGQALAVATVAGLLAVGVVLRRVLLLGLGAAGAVVVLPQVVSRYLAGGAWGAAAVLATGLAMLGTALWLARAQTKAS